MPDEVTPGHQPPASELEDVARTFVVDAGRRAMERRGSGLRVEQKTEDGLNPVTDLDRELERRLVSLVAERFPTHAVLGEEGADPEPGAQHVWVVDPIDGTANFMSGLPLFAVSVGVLRAGRLEAGAVGLPMSGEVLHAHAGGPARLDGRPVRVSDRDRLAADLVGVASRDFWLAFEVDVALRPLLGDPRWLGSTAAELAMVARGAVDYAVIEGAAPWDVAAGVVLVRAAGGEVLHWDAERRAWAALHGFDHNAPERLRAWDRPLIAAGRGLAAELSRHLRPAARR